MKHTIFLLLVIVASAAADSECSPPLNCTGVHDCPPVDDSPGVKIVSGKDYCSCCPVPITYVGRDESELAAHRSVALCSNTAANRRANCPMISTSSQFILH